MYGLADDYVVEPESRDAYHFDLASDEEDENNQHRYESCSCAVMQLASALGFACHLQRDFHILPPLLFLCLAMNSWSFYNGIWPIYMHTLLYNAQHGNIRVLNSQAGIYLNLADHGISSMKKWPVHFLPAESSRHDPF